MELRKSECGDGFGGNRRCPRRPVVQATIRMDRGVIVAQDSVMPEDIFFEISLPHLLIASGDNARQVAICRHDVHNALPDEWQDNSREQKGSSNLSFETCQLGLITPKPLKWRSPPGSKSHSRRSPLVATRNSAVCVSLCRPILDRRFLSQPSRMLNVTGAWANLPSAGPHC